MSFAWPAALLGLLLVPLLLLAHLRAVRRRSRYPVAFTNVELLGRVAPRTSSFRRALPLALLLAAVAALAVGMARPQVAVSVATKDGTVVLAMDTSGSMVANDVAPTRLAAATQAAKDFVNGLPSSFEAALVRFSSGATVSVAPTRDRGAMDRALDALQPGGGTAIGDAIQLALAATGPERRGSAAPAGARRGGRAILLLSDGSNTMGTDPLAAAREAKAQGVPVYTIAFGTAHGVVDDGSGGVIPVPPDPATLRGVADITGGRFFAVADAASLRRVYERIGTRVGSTTEHRDLTYAFAGGAAALLLAAGSLSVLRRSPLL